MLSHVTTALRQAPGVGRALLLVLALSCACSAAAAEPAESVEAQVKAAFLPKLANFVAWPETAFAATNSPIVIGILGDDPFGPQLDEDLKMILVHGRPLVVRRLNELPADGLHILFLPSPEVARTREIQKSLGGKPVLTIGDAAGFAEAGGMINFTKVAGELPFEINLEAAKSAGLQVSSRLLQVSTIVREKGREP